MDLNKHLRQGQLLYFSHIGDAITISENSCYRWLAFGDIIQSVMNRRQPSRLTLPHQIALLLPLIFFRPKNIVELGLGGGNIARFLTQLSDHITMTSIESNPVVIECFIRYFNPKNAPITIVSGNAQYWLESTDIEAVDWLLCDIYHHYLLDVNPRLVLLTSLLNKMTLTSCLTINLPDVTDQDINIYLTLLLQWQNTHSICYFHVPRYLNVVIHVIPKQWQSAFAWERQKNTYLPAYCYARWQKFWCCHHTINH